MGDTRKAKQGRVVAFTPGYTFESPEESWKMLVRGLYSTLITADSQRLGLSH